MKALKKVTLVCGAAASLSLGACQLVSGLDGLEPGDPASAASAATAGATASAAGAGGGGAGGAGGDATGGAGGGSTVSCTINCPEPFRDTMVTPGVLAINSTSIFWSAATLKPGQGSIWRASLADPTDEVVVVANIKPASIAADETFVYWTDNTSDVGALMYVDANMNDQVGNVYQTNPSSVEALTVDAQFVFWSLSTENAVRRRGKAPGDVDLQIAPNAAQTQELSREGNYLVWAAITNNGPTIVRALIDGSDFAPVVPAQPNGIAVFASYVYFTETDGGRVVRAPYAVQVQNGEELAIGESNPDRVLADGANLYWSTRGGIADCSTSPSGSVRRLSLSMPSAVAETLLVGITCSSNFVQSATHVYFATGNRIYSIKK